MTGVATRRRAAKLPEILVHRSVTKALRLYNQDRLRWMDEAAALGPLVAMRVGPARTLILSDPDGARSVLITDASSWKRPLVTTVPIRMAVGENLVTQADKAWSQLQPALAPDFRKRAVEARLTAIETVVADDIASLARRTPIDLDRTLGRLAMTVAAWVLFGERLERDVADELVEHQRVLIEWVGNRVGRVRSIVPLAPGRPARAMRKHQVMLGAYVDALVDRRRREQRPQGDLLDALLAARPGGRKLSDHELRSHVLGLLGAGNETTAVALGWAMVHGAAHPEQWAALRADPSPAPAYAAETLRLHPPVWGFTRIPVRSGVSVPIAGDRVPVRRSQALALNVWGMNRDPKLWPDPTSFAPARQRELSKEQERAMLPFSLGPRGCIGQHLALAEMHMLLPLLARHGDITVDGPIVERPIFTLRVEGGLRGRFTGPG
jgi:cytochrome P450